jgi:homoserine O-succinyltransferase/O-acetyltransferase
MTIDNPTIKIAILDLYDGVENQGMRCLREIIGIWSQQQQITVICHEFDVRKKNSVPDLSYHAYISSGGPGSPLDTIDTEWEKCYFNWLSMVENYNNNIVNEQKKHVLFICHSFQLLCRHYAIATVCKRISTSFGVFPVHPIENEFDEPIFEGLQSPFFIVDSREYQVIKPNYDIIDAMGATILAIEKNRPHVPYERAIMAVRFNQYFVGTQFHPEADAIGMGMYLQKPEKKQSVIDNHGLPKWQSMVDQLNDPLKISDTYSHILPNFLNIAIGEMALV